MASVRGSLPLDSSGYRPTHLRDVTHVRFDCSATLARTVFQMAVQDNRFMAGYAWFVTEDVMRGVRPAAGGSVDRMADYPVGLIAVAASRRQLRPATLMRNTVRLIARGMRRYQRKTAAAGITTGTFERRQRSSTAAGPFNSGSSCWSDGRPPYFADGELLYR